MPAIDLSHMTLAEKLDLIGEIWDSIETDDIPLTAMRAAIRATGSGGRSNRPRCAVAIYADL
jgi:hypothetical protein